MFLGAKLCHRCPLNISLYTVDHDMTAVELRSVVQAKVANRVRKRARGQLSQIGLIRIGKIDEPALGDFDAVIPSFKLLTQACQVNLPYAALFEK